ncbi:MAG: T9SS type A sorting domain-containing protein [Reichenbachiella sp.]
MIQFYKQKSKLLVLLLFVIGKFTDSFSQQQIQLELLSTYHTGLFDESAAEISSYDSDSKRLFVTNGATGEIDIYDISDPSNILLHSTIDLSPYGKSANSVSVKDGIVATAVENNNKQLPGRAVFFDINGNFINQVTAGALPDMVTFTRNGRYVLLANEGEPSDDYTVDPEGSVTIVDLVVGVESITQSDVTQVNFQAYNNIVLDPSIRVTANPGNSTVAQDLEPEYISTSKNSKYAWVACQENNAMALIDIRKGMVIDLIGLGFKDHSIAGNGIDASNKTSGIEINTWPAKGMYMPDAITNYKRWGREYVVLANEGDSRDYSGYSEETRVEDLVLDPFAFPDAAALQAETALGRIKTTIATGDADGDGLFEEIYTYGARSFSIRKGNGKIVFDSGDELERITAEALPNDFNSTNDENFSFKDRSDDKGPEPEAVEVAKIKGRHYVFIGLERVGGIAVYDITNPYHPFFIEYLNNRNFTVDAQTEAAGDLGPEDILFIKKKNSPNNRNMIVVANEVSGSISIYNVNNVRQNEDDTDEDARKIDVDEKIFQDETTGAPVIAHSFVFYPNPVSNGIIHFQNRTDVTMYSMSGVEVLRAKGALTIDVSKVGKGMYILKNQNGLTNRIYIN